MIVAAVALLAGIGLLLGSVAVLFGVPAATALGGLVLVVGSLMVEV